MAGNLFSLIIVMGIAAFSATLVTGPTMQTTDLSMNFYGAPTVSQSVHIR
ncbi:MAG: hypothetical protein AAF638_06975 [Pseudomonadota bacterium]